MPSSGERATREGEWRRASACNPFNDCVEIAPRGGRVAVRDSKARQGNHLLFDGMSWTAFLGLLRTRH